jgi:hypothetical protein
MLNYNASLKEAIDAINQGLEQLQQLTWTGNSISRMPEEIVKEFTASDPNYLLDELFTIEESGKYRLEISGKGKSAYTVKSPQTGKVVYTEKDIDDSYKTSDLILGKGDELYVHGSPDQEQYIYIKVIRVCTILELIQEMLATYAITQRTVNARIDNLLSAKSEETEDENFLTQLVLDLRVNYDGDLFLTPQQRFFALEKRVKMLEEQNNTPGE